MILEATFHLQMRWILSTVENSQNPLNRLSNPEANATGRLIPYKSTPYLNFYNIDE